MKIGKESKVVNNASEIKKPFKIGRNTKLKQYRVENGVGKFFDSFCESCNNEVIVTGKVRNCDEAERFIIPNGVKVILSGAFENCQELTAIECPESLESINPGAFVDCPKLKEIILPASVKWVRCYSPCGTWSRTIDAPFSELVDLISDGFRIELKP